MPVSSVLAERLFVASINPMSRIGKQLMTIPTGVTVDIQNGWITVKGPKGELKRAIHPAVTIEKTDAGLTVHVTHPDEKSERSLWGTFGAHVKNMITGVTAGFKKQLEINGVGYRVAIQGADLKLEVGYSHPVIFPVPDGIKVSVEKNVMTIEGIDKEQVGQVAATIRDIKKPEPYKGKGIKYIDEIIRRKAGKAAKAGA